MQTAEGDAGHKREGVDMRVAHGHQGFELFLDNLRAAGEGLRITDEPAEVDVDGGVDGGAPEGEITKLDGVEFPQFFGEPEISDRPG
ncbi:MAG: hypothetical protein M5U18_06855 [Dehalococcoidia bacterium]|nr:hypothetical protein [Dehalococcoidia bacterium]